MAGFGRAVSEARATGISVYLIPCFLRHLPAKNAESTLNTLMPFQNQIIGVGLDSSEVGHPPSKFADIFASARRTGLKLVAYAGEEGPPECVWEAIRTLDVDRIDHGNRAMEDAALVQMLVQTQMTLALCLLSNLRLCVIDDLASHPLKAMLDAGLRVTVNSDDPAYFGGYVNENFVAVSEALNLSGEEIVTLARNSFRGSFLSDTEEQQFDSQIAANFRVDST